MFWKDNKESAKPKIDFAKELNVLIAKAMNSGTSSWDIEHQLTAASQQMTYQRTMRSVA
jgi:hypothetical protein